MIALVRDLERWDDEHLGDAPEERDDDEDVLEPHAFRPFVDRTPESSERNGRAGRPKADRNRLQAKCCARKHQLGRGPDRMRGMTVDARRLFASRRVRWVFIAASVLGLVIGIDTLILHLRLDPLADVRAYYDAGARLNAGLPLYDQPATTNDPGFYRYPPLLAIAFRPLALLPYETAALIWEAFLIVLFVGTLVRLGLRNEWTWIVSGWLAAPIAWSLAIGQAQVAVTFLVALGAPWAIALAGHLKILPVIVVRLLARAARLAGGRTVRGLVVGLDRRDVRPRAGRHDRVHRLLGPLPGRRGPEPVALCDLAGAVGRLRRRARWSLALRYAPTRAGWPLAVAASVLATPRLLMYQLSTLQAGAAADDEALDDGDHAASESVDARAAVDDGVASGTRAARSDVQ